MATVFPQERRFLELALAQAIARHQLTVVYQPQVNPQTTMVTGFEALLRWDHPQFGSISPTVFIPIAEEVGLIHELGDWVLQRAIKQLKKWHQQSQQTFRMAVNISVHQVTAPHFFERLQNLLVSHQVAPQHLELEITESVLIEDFQNICAVLASLQKLGVKIAIDDFGTGYASFNYTRLFGWDTLKLDRCFIKNLHCNKVNSAITKNLINMSHDLGFKVVAEGIEHPEELAMLKQFCCDEVQGYYFSRPLMPALLEIQQITGGHLMPGASAYLAA
ncbi:bifunctional diguanylate cyclase/phosphodiesterase [Picosynechococcus sp. PCC 7117]|uniref:putative bifunctional diguanylate cyclase/phosphodiesterase n=1 Tax=Picosynechococcus sp. PCC 7117 TaxID=195498 RepID=UPI00081051CE|nr:EAL domain-containing protein [Picosynechococcus sp. PCC 7117]ANV87931.1 hypothetical protein AWQ22_10925 [Picosynechococcus sp. PCC 7117]